MKKITLILLFATTSLMAQIGIGTTSPDPATVLDISATLGTGFGGLKIPTLTSAELAMIPLPIPDGMLVYLSDGPLRSLRIYDAVGTYATEIEKWLPVYTMPAVNTTNVEFAASTASIDENTQAVISISLVNPSANVTTVDVALNASSTAGVLGTDYNLMYNGAAVTAFPFTVSFAANATNQDITVITLADNADIDDESLILDLQNLAGGTFASLGTTTSMNITINDDDEATVVSFAATTGNVDESSTATFTISLAANATVETTVEVALNASSTIGALGTAYDVEYGNFITGFPFTVTFPIGSMSQTFDVYAYDDAANITDETIVLDLQNVMGGLLPTIEASNDSMTITVNDDDEATTISFNTATGTVDENDVDTFTIDLINPSSSVTTVDVVLDANSTAGVLGTDYVIEYGGNFITAFPFTVTFPANATSQTFDIFIYDDTNDVNENIILNLQNLTGGLAPVLGTNDSLTVTAVDDDGSGPVVIGVQDFEQTPATPVLPFNDIQNGSLQTGSGNTPSSPNFLDARSYGVANNTADIEFGPVDASSYNSASLTFRIAAFSGTSGNGIDTSDEANVFVSLDGGSTWSHEFNMSGSSVNQRYDFTATGSETIVYDGDNTPTVVTTGSGSTGISTITINGITATNNVMVAIVLDSNSSSELWVIDNVQLFGN